MKANNMQVESHREINVKRNLANSLLFERNPNWQRDQNADEYSKIGRKPPDLILQTAATSNTRRDDKLCRFHRAFRADSARRNGPGAGKISSTHELARASRMAIKSKQGEMDKLVDAYLQNRQMSELENYLRRGQALKDTSDEELKQRWIKAMRNWASAASAGFTISDQERADAQAEFGLRKLELPFEEIAEDWETLRETIRRVRKNPAAQEAFNKLGKDMIEFGKSGTKTRKN
jgi:hypothetical protein